MLFYWWSCLSRYTDDITPRCLCLMFLFQSHQWKSASIQIQALNSNTALGNWEENKEKINHGQRRHRYNGAAKTTSDVIPAIFTKQDHREWWEWSIWQQNKGVTVHHVHQRTDISSIRWFLFSGRFFRFSKCLLQGVVLLFKMQKVSLIYKHATGNHVHAFIFLKGTPPNFGLLLFYSIPVSTMKHQVHNSNVRSKFYATGLFRTHILYIHTQTHTQSCSAKTIFEAFFSSSDLFLSICVVAVLFRPED